MIHRRRKPLAELDLQPSGYRLLLCHRRPAGTHRMDFQGRFGSTIAEAALGLQRSLGYTRFERLEQFQHPNLLGQVMAKSRKWIAVSLVAVWTGRKLPRIEGGLFPTESQELDIIDQLWWESEAHMLSTLGSPAGRVAAKELASLARPFVDHTFVIAGPQYQVLPRTCDHPATKIVFCLRRKHGSDRAEMQNYWLRRHGALVQSLQPKLKSWGYEQVHASSSARVEKLASLFRVGEAEPFDGAACLSYDKPETLRRTFLEPGCQRANLALQKDELNFVNGQRCLLAFGEERGMHKAERAPAGISAFDERSGSAQ